MNISIIVRQAAIYDHISKNKIRVSIKNSFFVVAIGGRRERFICHIDINSHPHQLRVRQKKDIRVDNFHFFRIVPIFVTLQFDV